MKHLVLILSIGFCSTAAAQTNDTPSSVQLRVAKDRLFNGDTLQYTVQTEHNADLEIAVFSERELVFHERAKLTAGVHPYSAFTENLAPGKYFVLVTGKDIHQQQVVQVKSKK